MKVSRTSSLVAEIAERSAKRGNCSERFRTNGIWSNALPHQLILI